MNESSRSNGIYIGKVSGFSMQPCIRARIPGSGLVMLDIIGMGAAITLYIYSRPDVSGCKLLHGLDKDLCNSSQT